MDAGSLGQIVFNSLPSFLKGTVTFTRQNVATYNPVTGVTVYTTVTASARCVSQPAKGTMSESFAQGVQVSERYIQVTVPAADLKGFVPKAGDTVDLGGMTFVVYGVEQIQPDGSSAAVYTVTVQR